MRHIFVDLMIICFIICSAGDTYSKGESGLCYCDILLYLCFFKKNRSKSLFKFVSSKKINNKQLGLFDSEEMLFLIFFLFPIWFAMKWAGQFGGRYLEIEREKERDKEHFIFYCFFTFKNFSPYLLFFFRVGNQ